MVSFFLLMRSIGNCGFCFYIFVKFVYISWVQAVGGHLCQSTRLKQWLCMIHFSFFLKNNSDSYFLANNFPKCLDT